MGINPNSGDGVEKNYTVDGRTDATSIVSDAEHTGNEAGKVFAQIAAQADSANKGTSDLSKRVKAIEGKLANNGVFQVRDGKLAPLGTVKWTYWTLGRIYPPVGTYWVESTVGVSVEKRGKANVPLTLPGPVTFDEGDYLLLFSMKDGQAIRLSAV